jgi:hypothetical protein
MVNYLVVLFKNKKRKKIINKFVTFSRAKQYYDKLLKESNDVIFNVELENGMDARYELGLIELSDNQLIPVYMTDEYGRSSKVKLEGDGMTLFNIGYYKKEEKIYDLSKNKKITTQQLIKTYLKGDGLKMISSLNNKIIVQDDEKINLLLERQSALNELLGLEGFELSQKKFVKSCLIQLQLELNKMTPKSIETEQRLEVESESSLEQISREVTP